MGEDNTKVLSNVIRIDDERIQDHLKHIVRGGVEETLNVLLDAGRIAWSGGGPLRANGSQVEHAGFSGHGLEPEQEDLGLDR